MKICIFSRPFHPAVGGLEQIAKILAFEFSAAGHGVEVVTDTPSTVTDMVTFPFIITRTSSFLERFRAFRRADVILFMNVTLYGVPVAMIAGRPFVLSHHGIYRPSVASVKGLILEFVKRQLTRFYVNISVSRFVAGHIPGTSILIPNTYESELFIASQLQRVRDFVFCGRLVSDKGVEVLIRAFRKVVDVYPKATLTIIGDGPEKKYLETLTTAQKLEKNVEFTGILRGRPLAEKVKEHVCMVIPSLWEEPFGIVALEGIASCDTVISARRGGLPEAVGECGLLVEPNVDVVAQAMNQVMDAGSKGTSLPGQPSPAQRAVHLRKHTPQRIALQYLDVLDSASKS